MLMIKILLTVCLVWTFVSGCERQGLEKHCSGPAVVPLSAEAQMVKKGVEDLKNGMFRKGYDQMVVANRLVLKLDQLAVHERPQIAHVFAELIEALEPVGGTNMRKRVTWLFNYQLLISLTHHYATYLDDLEWPFRQYALCCTRYEDAMSECRDALARTTDREEKRQLHHGLAEFQSDYGLFMALIRKTYLPFVAEKTLPPERYLYWKNYFEEKERELALSKRVDGK